MFWNFKYVFFVFLSLPSCPTFVSGLFEVATSQHCTIPTYDQILCRQPLHTNAILCQYKFGLVSYYRTIAVLFFHPSKKKTFCRALVSSCSSFQPMFFFRKPQSIPPGYACGAFHLLSLFGVELLTTLPISAPGFQQAWDLVTAHCFAFHFISGLCRWLCSWVLSYCGFLIVCFVFTEPFKKVSKCIF